MGKQHKRESEKDGTEKAKSKSTNKKISVQQERNERNERNEQ